MHYIYKITNLVTGHYYIGAHSTRDFNDGYMGSGVLIKKAIKFYGLENFEKIILKECKSRQDMFKWERKIITYKIIKDKNCYNLITGGKRKSKNTRIVSAKTKNCKEILNDYRRKNK